jgi:hypothetical protein
MHCMVVYKRPRTQLLLGGFISIALYTYKLRLVPATRNPCSRSDPHVNKLLRALGVHGVIPFGRPAKNILIRFQTHSCRTTPFMHY